MPRQVLSDALIRKAVAPASGRSEIWDSYERGLYVRLYPSRETAAGDANRKVWGLRYRADGRQRRFKLGEFPSMSLQDARKRARALKAQIDAGNDPQAEKVAARHAEAPLTVREAAEHFLEYYNRIGRRPRTVEQMTWGIRKQLIPMFGSRELENVSKRELIRALDTMAARPHNSANLNFRLWRVFFNWTVERDYREFSPLGNVRNPLPMKSRDRWLGKDDEQELGELMGAFDTEPFPFGPFLKMLLLTGQRRSEIANMRWSQVSETARQWVIPQELAKNGREHTVPLSSAAWTVLQSVPRSSDLVFSTTGRTPISGFSRVKARVADVLNNERKQAQKEPLASWTLHDLRRTAASNMAKLGIQPHVIEAVLNHMSGQVSGIAAVYNRHTYDQEKREALETWGSYLLGLVGRSEPSNIVPFKRRHV